MERTVLKGKIKEHLYLLCALFRFPAFKKSQPVYQK